LKIDILGAQSAEKSDLCRQLSLHFQHSDALAVADLAHNDLALSSLRKADITLVMGLNMPFDNEAMCEDALIRSTLNRCGINYHMVYGAGESRLQNALRCFDPVRFEPETQTSVQQLRKWQIKTCERCSDPECEHRLFTDLLKQS
jgi:hypothetical protein